MMIIPQEKHESKLFEVLLPKAIYQFEAVSQVYPLKPEPALRSNISSRA